MEQVAKQVMKQTTKQELSRYQIQIIKTGEIFLSCSDLIKCKKLLEQMIIMDKELKMPRVKRYALIDGNTSNILLTK